jgi:MoaA/NifB/PqqE/SkfB family radical SAM enzyme
VKVAVLMLTPQCNMHCGFCGAEAGFDSIPYADAAALVDRLAAGGTQSLVLGGGEPFLWKQDLFKLAHHARQRGLLTQVGSNGTLAPQDDAALHEFDRWILPVESMDAAVHDGMRPYEGGHLHQVRHLLERLRRLGREATVSTLVSQENFEPLGRIGAWLQDYQEGGGRLHAWHLYKFLPVGRGGRFQAARFATDPEDFNALGALLKRRYPALKIYLRPDMYHSKETSFYWWHEGALQGLGPGWQGPQELAHL